MSKLCNVLFYRYGPLRNVWCMRFEANNSYFKSLPLKHFTNIPETLATWHQADQGNTCMNLLGPGPGKCASNYLYRGDEVVESTCVFLNNSGCMLANV